jgi:hypothetical protein
MTGALQRSIEWMAEDTATLVILRARPEAKRAGEIFQREILSRWLGATSGGSKASAQRPF